MTGWRTSVIRNGTLRGPIRGQDEWLTPAVSAHCSRGKPPSTACDYSDDGLAPGEGCICGVHYFDRWDDVVRSFYKPSPLFVRRILLRIEVGGKIVPRQKREMACERARLLQLVVPFVGGLEPAREVADALGVPVLFWPELPLEPGFEREALSIEGALALARTLWRSSDRLHGEAHAYAVAATALDLAADVPGADRELVFLFGVLHDACRRRSRNHGKDAAELAGNLLAIEASRLEVLCTALELHAAGRVSDDPTVGACWDADRLQLTRVGARVKPELLSTTAAREPGRLEQAAARREEPIDWPALLARVQA